MATYESLINQADLALQVRLNNSLDANYSSPTLWGTTIGTSQFIQDHPFNSGSYSYYDIEDNLTVPVSSRYHFVDSDSSTPAGHVNVISTGVTHEIWFKYTLDATNGVPQTLIFAGSGYNATYGETARLTVSLTGGATYGAGNVGRLSVIVRPVSASNTTYSSIYVTPNEWHLIHVETVYRSSAIGTVLFIDGIRDTSASTTVATATSTILNDYTFGGIKATSPYTNTTIRYCEFAVYNRVLSATEKLERYMVAKQEASPSLSEAIVSSNPKIFWKFDNTSTTDAVPNYGTATIDSLFYAFGAAVSVNQDGAEDKAWSINPSATSSQNRVYSPPGASAVIQEAIATPGGYSFEWMQKIPLRNAAVANHGVVLFNGLGGGSGSQYLPTAINTGYMATNLLIGIGHSDVKQPYWNGTSWLTGTLSALTRNQHFNVADEQWHHFIYTFTKVGTLQKGTLYCDGAVIRERIFSAGDWETATIPYVVYPYEAFEIFGITGYSPSDGRIHTIDDFAVYNRVLPVSEIISHYKAWAGPATMLTGLVKYWTGTAWATAIATKVWNGTQWIDWVKKYWNGTDWILV